VRAGRRSAALSRLPRPAGLVPSNGFSAAYKRSYPWQAGFTRALGIFVPGLPGIHLVDDREIQGTGRIIPYRDHSPPVDGISERTLATPLRTGQRCRACFEEVPLFAFTAPEQALQSRRPLAVSIAAHVVGCCLLVILRFSTELTSAPAAAQHFTLLAPVVERPVSRPKTPVEHPRLYRPIAKLRQPDLVKAAIILALPAVETPPALPEMPKPLPAPVILPAIRTVVFAEAKPAAPAASPRPVAKPSGFQSEEIRTTTPGRGILKTVGGFESASAGTAGTARTAVASSRPGEFGGASMSASSVRPGKIANAAFGDTTVETGLRTAPRQIAAAAMTPVEIISKPRPAYTDEARAKRIEGEVLLEMQFSATGEARVLRIVRGLGHGLDETALAAANGIKFRPATRDGAAVDSAAIVHIVFQLAN
jgi:TonB family protein